MKLLRLVCRDNIVRFGIVMPDRKIMMINSCKYFGDRLSSNNAPLLYSKSLLKKRDYITEVTDEKSIKEAEDFYKDYKKQQKLQAQLDSLNKAVEESKVVVTKHLDAIDRKIIQDKRLAELDKVITGNENFRMSFTKDLDTDYAIAVIKKTDRRCFFRYGLAYRGATQRLISKEDAIERCNKRGWIDITANDDYIEINEMGENDMW